VLPEVLSLPEIWDDAVHRRSEQLKRRHRALEITDAVLDIPSRTGSINGYDVGVGSCTCIDFRERRLPCKHIYYLLTQIADSENPFGA
jgi:hypothetical protein